MAEACQSFTVLPGDNWKLSRNCDKWGSNETVSLSNLYGFYVVIMPLQMACHHEILEKSMRDRNRHALAPTVIGVRARGGGGGAAAPPVTENFEIVRAKR